MYKLSYCWKCEEIKENHKVLNAMMPEEVIETVSKYEKCRKCTLAHKFNEKLEGADKHTIHK